MERTTISRALQLRDNNSFEHIYFAVVKVMDFALHIPVELCDKKRKLLSSSECVWTTVLSQGNRNYISGLRKTFFQCK